RQYEVAAGGATSCLALLFGSRSSRGRDWLDIVKERGNIRDGITWARWQDRRVVHEWDIDHIAEVRQARRRADRLRGTARMGPRRWGDLHFFLCRLWIIDAQSQIRRRGRWGLRSGLAVWIEPLSALWTAQAPRSSFLWNRQFYTACRTMYDSRHGN